MSWDDDDDAFFAQIDVDSAVQQARARQQQQPQPHKCVASPQQHPWRPAGWPAQQVPTSRPGQEQQRQQPKLGLQQQQVLPGRPGPPQHVSAQPLPQQAVLYERPGQQQLVGAPQPCQPQALPGRPGPPQHQQYVAAPQLPQRRPGAPQTQQQQRMGGPATTGLRALFATGAVGDDSWQVAGPPQAAPAPLAQAPAAGQWPPPPQQQHLHSAQPPGQWPQRQLPAQQQPGRRAMQHHPQGWPCVGGAPHTNVEQRQHQPDRPLQHGPSIYGQQQQQVNQPPGTYRQLQQEGPCREQQQQQQQQHRQQQQEGPCRGQQQQQQQHRQQQQQHRQQQQSYGQQQQQPCRQQHRPSGGNQQEQHASGGLQQQQQEKNPVVAAGAGRQGPSNGPASGTGQGAASSGHGLGPLLHVTLELGRDHMVEVKLGYREEVTDALKRIPGGLWDARGRFWKFPLSQHGRIVEVLQGMHGKTARISLQDLPPIVSSVLNAAAACPDDSERYCHIPEALEQQLMPFQREGISFALRHGGRALIGDEMGLGKTVQAIALASAYRDEWPVLVVAPSSLREAWADALHRWLGVTADRMHIVHSGKDAQNVPKSVQFLIVSYNFVQKMDLGKRFGMIICDESHYLKEGNSQRTKATVPLIKEIRRAILLSGTPALNKPKEIFQQLAALVPKARIKLSQFGERYCQGNRFDKYGGASNLAELNALLKNSIMVRRLKSEVLTQLPRKRRQQVMLDLDEDAKKQLAGLQRQLEVVRQVIGQEARQDAASGGGAGGGGAARAEQNAVITQLYNKTAEVKAKAVQDYVTLLLENGQKFLVFGHHTSMLDAIEHACNRFKSGKKGIKYIRIDGSTPSSKRQSLVNDFQDNEDYRVAVLSIRAAGTGLTLTAASTVVFAEMTWVPGETIQAEDRAHRIGQASSVNVYFLHARGSIDDLIWQSIQNKLDSVGEAIDGEAQALDARRVEALERGQMTLAPFMTQAPTPAQQQQQGAGGAGRPGPGGGKGPGVAPKSPSKTHQSSLLNFFAGSSRQKAEQGGPPHQPHPPPTQQQFQHWQAHAQPGLQQQHQQPQENGCRQGWQQAPPGGALPPLHGPSGLANAVQIAAGPSKAAGVKRPFEGGG